MARVAVISAAASIPTIASSSSARPEVLVRSALKLTEDTFLQHDAERRPRKVIQVMHEAQVCKPDNTSAFAVAGLHC